MISKTPDQIKVKEAVNKMLANYFNERIRKAKDIDKKFADLWINMKTVVGGGGKRYRPYLLVLSYAAYGGKQFDEIMPIAMSLELLHQSMLAHDDVIDRDYIRHSKPNISGLLQKRYRKYTTDFIHIADSGAILAGDLMLSDVYQVILKSSLDTMLKLQIISKLGEVVFDVGAGQLLDTESTILPIEESLVLKIAELKTARYSFGTPLILGSMLAGKDSAEFEKLEELGNNLGIAYQLHDDIQGMFGEEQKTGKSNIGDLREGKKTMLIMEAFTRTKDSEKVKLSGLVGKSDANAKDLKTAREIITDCGAKQATTNKMLEYIDKALDDFKKLDIDSGAKDNLAKIARSMKNF